MQTIKILFKYQSNNSVEILDLSSVNKYFHQKLSFLSNLEFLRTCSVSIESQIQVDFR